MKAIRSGLDRFLSGSPQRKPFSIIRDMEFKPANEALDASLKDLARQGLISSTNHKHPISKEDLEALYAFIYYTTSTLTNTLSPPLTSPHYTQTFHTQTPSMPSSPATKY